MDNIKDSQKDIVNTNVATIDIKDNSPIDFFSKNESFVFVYKKTEKLATALYMVTNLFGDSEPMKWTLRSKISNLLSFIIGFKDVVGARVDEFSNDVKTQVLEIVSLLEIASRSGLVSNMNFSILKSEFMNTVAFLTESSSLSKVLEFHRADLKKDFFNVSQNKGLSPVYKGQDLAKNVFKKVVQENVSDALLDINSGIYPQENQVEGHHKYSNRQNIILGLLKRKKDVVIQDVAKVIVDCSEKTLQRELMSLVQEGVVKRTGERRWSKYSLIVDF